MLRLRHVGLFAAITLSAAVVPNPASAGNIFLTGHDADFHATEDNSSSAFAALNSEVIFVQNGSTLPVLVFDTGSLELASALTTLGIANTVVDPSGTIADSVFDPTLYSAFIVASDESCGGCDLTDADLANIASHSTAINAFFNAGGGILGLAAAQDASGYAYVPEAAANGGGNPPSDGFVETAAGTSAGLLAENGDATHNFFPTPGTGGLSSAYQVAETNGDNVESVFLRNGTITCTGESCTIGTGAVPEPATWAMMLMGFGALGFTMRRKRRSSRVARLV